jgi:EmrB/QacA subfamily drug resistance transporter
VNEPASPAAPAAPGPPSAGPPGQALDQGNPRKWWILAAVSIGMFMGLLDVTIVNIAMPAIISDLHTTVTHASWVLNAYSLVLAVCFLSMGRVADRYGLKRVFLFGLVTFTLASMACGFAPTIDWLIAFRAVQGIGGAALLTISLPIVLGAFPRRQQGMAVGLWGALGTAAAAVGPVLGGVLVTYGHWSWIFFVNVPIGVLALVICGIVLPRSAKQERRPGGLDFPGIVISGVGLFMLTLGLVQGNEWGWTSGAVIGLLVAAAATFPLFMWWETRTASPMFPVNLLRIRSFTAANSSIMFIGLAMGGTFLMVVIFLVSVLGYSELRAAMALTVMPVIALIVAPNAGRLNDRIGPRIPAAVGAACFAVGLALLAQLGGGTTLWDVMWRVAFLGIGMGLAMPTLSAASMASLPTEVRGVGSGSLNTMRQVGFTLGVALVVAIFTHTVAQNAQQATKQSVGLVVTRQALSPVQKKIYAGTIIKNAKAAASGGGAGVLTTTPLKGSPMPPSGTPQAAAWQALNKAIAAIYKHDVARSFSWPFYAAAFAALLAVIPALFTGRRLGEHEGHEELSREERLKAAGEAEAAEAGAPLIGE